LFLFRRIFVLDHARRLEAPFAGFSAVAYFRNLTSKIAFLRFPLVVTSRNFPQWERAQRACVAQA
jgi:hypothetical protein